MPSQGEKDGSPPLVSVIIACFNQAHFLPDAIESVLAQTHTNVEVVLVDDGSTDATPDVTRRYPSVRYVRQENRGLAAARNTGTAESKGGYLVFLDADDRLLPRALQVGVECFREHPESAFVSGGYRRIDARGSVISEPPPARIEGDHYLALLRGNYVGMHATVMYARDLLEQSGGFDASLTACEDYDLYLRLARTHSASCHAEVIAEYRTLETSMSSDNGRMLEAATTVLRAQRRYLAEDRRRKAAYAEGMRYWQELYGVPLVDDVLRSWTSWRSGGLGFAMRGLSTLLRRAPRTLLRKLCVRVASAVLPPGLLATVLRTGARWGGRTYYPRVGRVRYGDLRRLAPVSHSFGFDRGLPIDRYYIERFLGSRAEDIRGRVLEIGDASYTHSFGGSRVSRSDVLHVSEGNPEATFVADLADAPHLPADAFDCVVLTQTLQLVYELRAAVATLYRILKPGGVLLLTVPGVSQISQDPWRESWHWGFTSLAIRRLLEEAFPATLVDVEAHGNVLAATAFLQGIAVEELEPAELDHHDAQYEMLITARAVKPA
jgi:glycosyltransferase involved in cell wall biosynthesis/SAM-dependent methyltransferase